MGSGTTGKDVSPPAESSSGVSIGAALDKFGKGLKNGGYLPSETANLELDNCGMLQSMLSMVDSSIDCSNPTGTTGELPQGHVDLAPAVVGRHALVSASVDENVVEAWSPFVDTLSTENGFSANRYDKCDGLLKGFSGSVSTKEFDVDLVGGGKGKFGATYPKELKYSPSGGTGSHALFLVPEADHNGAFRLNNELCQWIACWAGKGLGMLVKSVATPQQALQTLKTFAANSLKHVVLGGHGSPGSLGWGDGHPASNGLFMGSAMTKKVLGELKQKLAADGSVVIDACETAYGSENRMPGEVARGAKEGTLKPQNLFEHVKVDLKDNKVYAPTRSYSVNDYHSAANFRTGDCTPDARPHRWHSPKYGDLGKVVSALQQSPP